MPIAGATALRLVRYLDRVRDTATAWNAGRATVSRARAMNEKPHADGTAPTPPEPPDPPTTVTPVNREMLHLLGYSDEDISRMIAPAPPAPRPAGVSLIITQAQREQLRARGYGDEEIRTMTPAEAHRRLGL
jgi:hypothetical protein